MGPGCPDSSEQLCLQPVACGQHQERLFLISFMVRDNFEKKNHHTTAKIRSSGSTVVQTGLKKFQLG